MMRRTWRYHEGCYFHQSILQTQFLSVSVHISWETRENYKKLMLQSAIWNGLPFLTLTLTCLKTSWWQLASQIASAHGGAARVKLYRQLKHIVLSHDMNKGWIKYNIKQKGSKYHGWNIRWRGESQIVALNHATQKCVTNAPWWLIPW